MSAVERNLEAEVKFTVDEGFAVPDLSGVTRDATLVALPPRSLETVYYDTRDLRLTRWGISLRCRRGEEGVRRNTGRWTVKLPSAADGIVTARHELTLDASATAVPTELASLVLGHTRGAPLGPVASLRSERTRHILRAPGRDLVEVDDDQVSVIDDERVVLRFREVEVEQREGATAKVAGRVLKAMLAAGASITDGTSKVAQALGADVIGDPDIVVPEVGRDASVGDVARAALATSALQLLDEDPALRIAADPEAVHRARVATRRLRSDLRTFGVAFDANSISALRAELSWLAGVLGAVRDADVLAARLTRQSEALDVADHRGANGLIGKLDAQRSEATESLQGTLRSDRYLELLESLVRMSRRPPLLPEADQKALLALGAIIDDRLKKVRRAVDGLTDDADDASLHAVRIRVKKARYAAEASIGVCGQQAKRLAKALARLQDTLGEVNDAAAAEGWLRRACARSSGGQAISGGLLIAVNRREGGEALAAWPAAWRRVEREGRRWRS